MAKAPADTIKYNVYAEITIDGVVEKPDVVGAIFGQSEGLLGEDLELRDLQKTGRIGRIEVDIKAKSGKSTGSVIIPSSLDMVETSIIAAAVEGVDRVGPCNARIRVLKIEDARTAKRKKMVDRAKELLKTLMDEQIPESDILTEEVKKSVQLSEITSYKGLPAGPGVETADSVILVEGRADVLNLLKCGIKNAVAVGGTNISRMIVDLTKSKSAIAFLDGDRGGDIILKELMQVADIDFVARGPKGREVEELSKKEVIMALRRKVPPKQGGRQEGFEQPMTEDIIPSGETEIHPASGGGGEESKLREELSKVKGKLLTRLLDGEMNLIAEVEIKDLIDTLKDVKPAYVVLDGIVTQRLVDAAIRSDVKCIVGVNKSSIANSRGVRIITED
jgi:DNA primase